MRSEDGAEEWSWHQMATDETEQVGLLDRAESHASCVFGQPEPEPPVVGARGPEAGIDALRRVPLRADPRQGHLGGEEALNRGADLLLFRRADEPHRGSPSTRSPMMFFCTSIVPPPIVDMN